jgi:TMEM175 potassium channel family protein
MLVELAHIVLTRETFRQRVTAPEQKRTQQVQFIRAWITMAIFAFAAFAVFVPAGVRLALTTTFLLLHFRANLHRLTAADPH